MATSKHFLDQVKTGDVAAALQSALENAGSLTIVTHIAGAGSADDLPDSQKISTQIDAVAGTIETSVGEKFVQDESFKTLCEGHMQQVVAGCSSVRDNLDTIQALLDWVAEEPVTADGSDLGNGSHEPAWDGGIDEAPAANGIDAGAAGMAAAGLGAAAGMAAATTSSPAEDSMLDALETPAADSLDSLGLEETPNLEGIETADAGDSALLDDLDLGSAEGELDLGNELNLDAPGLDSPGLDAPGLEGDLDLGELSEQAEDAEPETEFLMADTGDTTELFGTDELGSEAPGDLGADLSADLSDAAAPLADAGNEDPLAGLELDADLGSDVGSDDPFNLGGDNSAAEAPVNLEEDTLAGVSWAESGSGESDLGLGGLDLGGESAPDGTPDPEVDDVALGAIGDFDSGMWDEASSDTVDIQEGESPAKVSRSLESLFSADEAAAPSAEGESGGNDPLSALFSDTSLDDIPSDASASKDSQENLATNPFEIDDLENDPFADLMLDDQNG